MKASGVLALAFLGYVAWRMGFEAGILLAAMLAVGFTIAATLRDPAPRGRLLNQAVPRGRTRAWVGIRFHRGPLVAGVTRWIGR